MQEAKALIGHYGKDIITGFHGRITGCASYITGCDQVCLTPPMKDDGKIEDGRWYDVNRINLVHEKGVISLSGGTEHGAPSGGGEQAPIY
jgi:hypothetical protein